MSCCQVIAKGFPHCLFLWFAAICRLSCSLTKRRHDATRLILLSEVILDFMLLYLLVWMKEYGFKLLWLLYWLYCGLLLASLFDMRTHRCSQHTLAVRGSSLGLCRFSICLNQSGINKAYLPRDLLFADYSLFIGPFPFNPQDRLCVKMQPFLIPVCHITMCDTHETFNNTSYAQPSLMLNSTLASMTDTVSPSFSVSSWSSKACVPEKDSWLVNL